MSSDPYWKASPTDLAMHVLDRRSPVTFHVAVDFDRRVDHEVLSRAWRTVQDEHAILRCRLDETDARWVPHGRTSQMSLVGEPLQSASVGPAETALLAQPLDADGPVARLALIERSQTQRLLLTAHHAAFDGRAALTVLDDLRIAYGTGAVERSIDTSPRTVGGALPDAAFPIALRESIISRSIARWRRLPKSQHRDPSDASNPEPATGYGVIELGPLLGELAEQRRRNGWSIDGLLTGLIAAAWERVWPGDGPSGWLLAADLRRHLGVVRGIGNLSGTEPIVVQRPFDSAVHVVRQTSAAVAALQSSYAGLAPELRAATMPWVGRGPLERGTELALRGGRRLRYTRVVSNLGMLPTSFDQWGDAVVTQAAFVGPLSRPPDSVFMALGRATSTTLTVRTSPDWITNADVAKLRRTITKLANEIVASARRY